MVVEIKFHKSIGHDRFYELYVNGLRLCGFYSLYVLFIRLRKWLNGDNNFYLLDEYEKGLLND